MKETHHDLQVPFCDVLHQETLLCEEFKLKMAGIVDIAF